ncbi:MAG: MarC family protein, partial [Candidatus Ratteibacteria bacterium]|nr:MarC family protein [Candidatus Ratteibacteria bacterium]
GLHHSKKWHIIIQSVITAMIVSLIFIAIGKYLFEMLGIMIADFMVAGGLLLFIISIIDIITGEKKQRGIDPESLGAVPIGVPLIVGPAVLTTTLLLVGQYGSFPTIFAVTVNILIAGLVFLTSDHIYKILGKSGAKTISKLASLLLAAIAVMIIRRGIITFITTDIMLLK